MSQPYVGEIRMFAGNFAPAGWALCQGQLVAISDNETLFNLIGTTYGGDGQSTFALPNLASRIPVHAGPGFVLGQMGGVEEVTLTTSQLPVHTHAPAANNNAGGVASPSGAYWGTTGINIYNTATPDGSVKMASGLLSSVGGSQPHDNMVPFLVVNFIISLFGVYPSQT